MIFMFSHTAVVSAVDLIKQQKMFLWLFGKREEEMVRLNRTETKSVFE